MITALGLLNAVESVFDTVESVKGVGYGHTGVLRSKETPPPQDPPRTLGIGLRQGPTGVRFLLSEVKLYG